MNRRKKEEIYLYYLIKALIKFETTSGISTEKMLQHFNGLSFKRKLPLQNLNLIPSERREDKSVWTARPFNYSQ